MGNPRNAPCTPRGTEQRVDIGRKSGLRPIGEHSEDWDAWDWQRYVDGAEIETAQSTRPTSARVSDDNTEGGRRTHQEKIHLLENGLKVLKMAF